MTDSSIRGSLQDEANEAGMTDYLYRLINRLLPREVYGFSGASPTHAERVRLVNFLTDLQDREKGKNRILELENAIGEELIKLEPELGKSPREALLKAGVWVDVPKPPEFEDVDELVVGRTRNGSGGVPLIKIFPIKEWTEAYTHFRYQARIFSFSEYLSKTQEAAKNAMVKIINIYDSAFYDNIRRDRTQEG